MIFKSKDFSFAIDVKRQMCGVANIDSTGMVANPEWPFHGMGNR